MQEGRNTLGQLESTIQTGPEAWEESLRVHTSLAHLPCTQQGLWLKDHLVS